MFQTFPTNRAYWLFRHFFFLAHAADASIGQHFVAERATALMRKPFGKTLAVESVVTLRGGD